MELGLGGKVALVTGASRGIGRAIAIALAREGCDIVATARDSALLETMAAEVRAAGRTAVTQAGDLRKPDTAAAVLELAKRAYGRLDILVNNAGATKRGDFFSMTDDDFLDGFALKFHAHVRLVRSAWPMLKASGGRIVNIIGVGGRTASADFTIGGPVNAALFNFTKAIAQLGTRDGVRVVGVNPGSIETERLKGRLATIAREAGVDEAEARRRNLAQLGVTRFGLPQEIGELVAFLAGDRAGYIHGALVDCDGGVTRGV
ncbi:MAG: SDR family oxidoreductase [Alphaproteobacteria bacterium]|nr:SDR family oxidoreductase [Alphaproteobacteria bacterium]